MEPWELTPEQARREAEMLAPQLEEADRLDAPLLARQLADDPWPDDADDGIRSEQSDGETKSKKEEL